MSIETNSNPDAAGMAEWERELLGLHDVDNSSPDDIEMYQIPEITIPDASKELARVAFQRANKPGRHDHGTRGQQIGVMAKEARRIVYPKSYTPRGVQLQKIAPDVVIGGLVGFEGHDEHPDDELMQTQQDAHIENIAMLDTVQARDYSTETESYSALTDKQRETILKSQVLTDTTEQGGSIHDDAGAYMRSPEFENLSVARRRGRTQSHYDQYERDPFDDKVDYIDGHLPVRL